SKNYADADPVLLQHDINITDLAMVLYTSGTTGRPKGVMLSHVNISSNTSSIIEYLKLTHNDSIVNILPFFYSFGNSILMTHLAVGGLVIIENNFMYPNKIVRTMLTERPTGFSGVPSTYYILLSKTSFLKYDWSSLRYISQAGGGMRVNIIKQLIKTLNNTKIFIMYGQTEASARLTYLEPVYVEKKIGSIGMAIPGVKIRIINGDGQDVKKGNVGEIIAKGDNIMMGYLNNPTESLKSLKDGWLYTGDMGYFDNEDFIYLTSRKSDFIKSGAYRISPGEIEEVIAEIEGILDVAVIGINDNLLGEAIMACINCPSECFDVEKIRKHCLAILPFYKVPRHFVYEPNIPLTASGKKQYHILRSKYKNFNFN
ncbi:MAG: AMP-binding protein, partial [Candidatus Neomarinimicrobiota bacterium]